jgi:hypothetical protein
MISRADWIEEKLQETDGGNNIPALIELLVTYHFSGWPLSEALTDMVVSILWEAHLSKGSGQRGHKGIHNARAEDWEQYIRYLAVRNELMALGMEELPPAKAAGRPKKNETDPRAAILSRAQKVLEARKDAKKCKLHQIARSYHDVRESLAKGEHRFHPQAFA